MSHELYFKSEEDIMKNEIPAAIFLVPPPPPPLLRKNIYQIIEGFYYKLFSNYTATAVFQYKTVDRILDIVSVIYLSTRKNK